MQVKLRTIKPKENGSWTKRLWAHILSIWDKLEFIVKGKCGTAGCSFGDLILLIGIII
jgi:hypothetical protein